MDMGTSPSRSIICRAGRQRTAMGVAEGREGGARLFSPWCPPLHTPPLPFPAALFLGTKGVLEQLLHHF